MDKKSNKSRIKQKMKNLIKQKKEQKQLNRRRRRRRRSRRSRRKVKEEEEMKRPGEEASAGSHRVSACASCV